MKKYIGNELMSKVHAIVIGTSAGGGKALNSILPGIPADFSIPVIIVQHISSDFFYDRSLTSLFENCPLKIKEADEKEPIRKGCVYLAPANYHLLIEKDKTFSLTTDERVNYSRPSIDILFETAADVYQSHLLGIILTGANKDGAEGTKMVKKKGGIVIVQDPAEAELEMMPEAAIEACRVDYVLSLDRIRQLFLFI